MEEHGYSVVRALAQGGCQSRVYEVHDREGRLRVLKQLPWMGEADRAQALQEVHLLSSLRHPCIVPYLESFLIRSTPSMPSEDILCLVMKRCERDLRQECLRVRLEAELAQDPQNAERKGSVEPRFKEQQVVSWLAQLCWGLQHLHNRKFLHRDLKPQNVLLSHGGRRAMLADFGVAGQVESTEGQRCSIVGTPAFMSPEMLEGRSYGLKTDQWALGCVLFEMMALAPPFASRGESYASVVSAVLHSGSIRSPPGYSAELKNCCEGLLARKPYARPSNKDLLRSNLLRSTFHAFVQSVEQAAALAGAQSAQSPPVSARNESGSRSASASASGGGGVDGAATVHTGSDSESPWTHSGSLRSTARSAVGIGGLDHDGLNSLASSRVLFLENETAETDAYMSDFESLSGESPVQRSRPVSSFSAYDQRFAETASSSASFAAASEGQRGLRQRPAGLGAAAARVLRGGGGGIEAFVDTTEAFDTPGLENSLSVRDELDSSSSAGGSGYLPDLTPEAAHDSLHDYGLCTDGWRQLLAEAEALLQPPPLDAGAQEESRKLRATLAAALGAPEKVDRALFFLRDRRPLGETAEADELLLQVEMLELLGDEGLKQLPLMERLMALEGASNPGGE